MYFGDVIYELWFCWNLEVWMLILSLLSEAGLRGMLRPASGACWGQSVRHAEAETPHLFFPSTPQLCLWSLLLCFYYLSRAMAGVVSVKKLSLMYSSLTFDNSESFWFLPTSYISSDYDRPAQFQHSGSAHLLCSHTASHHANILKIMHFASRLWGVASLKCRAREIDWLQLSTDVCDGNC